MPAPDPATIRDGSLLAMWQQLTWPAPGGPGTDPPAAYGWQQGIAPALPDGSYVVAPQSLFGATGDDSVWINNALVQASLDTGNYNSGVVRLLPVAYNCQTPIQLQSQSVLQGSLGTWLMASSSFTGSYMVVLANPATTSEATIRDVLIWCGNPSGATLTGPGGIQLDNTGWTAGSGSGPASTTDSLHTLVNVTVMNSGGDAFHFDNHVRELRCINCKAYRSQGSGFYVGDSGGLGSGCTDSHFTDCTAAFSFQHGFNVLGGNNMFQGCKSFASGNNFYTGFTNPAQGFNINGAQANVLTFVNCSAQQNYFFGFSLAGCLYVSVTGCQADSNGTGPSVSGAGISVNGITNCVITGNVGYDNTFITSNQVWGVQAAGSCPGTVLRDNPITGTSGTFTSTATNLNRGTATLAAGTVTVANTSVTAATQILLTIQTPGGTPGAVYVSARTAGTSFTITSTSGADTSTVAWELVY